MASPKLIICVKSCQAHKERGDHDAIRSTWGGNAKAMGVEVKFFIGGNEIKQHQADEVYLGGPDDYHNLPTKTRKICAWATGKVCDYIFLCDTDTFVNVPKLLATPFAQADYAGKISKPIGTTFRYNAVDRDGNGEVHERCYPWASGGYGYFLSRKAFHEVMYAFPDSWAEDLWVGQVMGGLAAVGEITIADLGIGHTDHFPSAQHGENYTPSSGWMQEKYLESK